MLKLAILAIALTALTACGADGGSDTQTTSAPVSHEQSDESGDCYFVEQDDGSVINLGPVEDAEAEEEAAKSKSTIIINNCSGTVSVTGDSVTVEAAEEGE